MKLKWIIALLAVALPAGAQMQSAPQHVRQQLQKAQSLQASQGGTPQAAPVTAAKPSVAPKAATAPKASAAQKHAPAARTRHARKHVAAAPRTPAEANARQEKEAAGGPDGKRDPFVSPVVERSNRAPCTGGKRCLPINDALLQGVIHSPRGDIAVVSNPESKVFFLRVNDPVLDGVVVGIAKDSITFREHYSDPLGRPLTRDVVKKLRGPA